ncbi:group II trans-sialidase superfamily, partial [Trypanosoma conorhini]
YSDIVAGYINAAAGWASLVAEINAGRWEVHTVFSRESQANRVGRAFYPTAVAKDNKVFLLVGSYDMIDDGSDSHWKEGNWSLELLVGEATQDKQIQWGQPQQLLPQIAQSAQAIGVDGFFSAGGSGVVMASGALVFPVVAARRGGSSLASTIIYSADEGITWALPKGMLPADCTSPLLAEWEAGQLLMIADCTFGRRVFESRDMGATWAETARTLSRVRGYFGADPLQRPRRVTSLTTATIAGTRVMLYTQTDYPLGEMEAEAEAKDLFLWATNNNRTFRVGPISMDADGNIPLSSALLYSNDKLHFLQERGNSKTRSLFLSPLTEELGTITSVLGTWAEQDSAFSKSSVPTAGLVGFLSDASSDATWDDAYRCLNAVVKNGKKVKNGFEFTGAESYAFWPVNMWDDGNVYGFANYEFALVATVLIQQAPKGSAPLLGASLEDHGSTKFVGLAYTAEMKWETVFNGTATVTDGGGAWESGKEYKVALMLQGSKGSVYVDGELVGSSDALPTPEARNFEISYFYFGDGEGGNDRGGRVAVTNVLLYNRPLSGEELAAPAGRGRGTPPPSGGSGDSSAAAEAKEEVDAHEAASGSGESAPSSSPEPGAGTGRERTGTEQVFGAEPSEQQRGPSPPADGAATAGPVGDAPVQNGREDDGQAQQTPPSHAPESVGGVPSASAAPTSETPNVAERELGADPQTAADADGGHEASSNAATAPLPGNGSAAFKNITGPFQLSTGSDDALRGCVSRLLLLAMLGVWGTTAL